MAAPVKDLVETESLAKAENEAPIPQISLVEDGHQDPPAVSPARRLQNQLSGAFHQSQRLAVPHEFATVLALFLACSLGTIAIVTLF